MDRAQIYTRARRPAESYVGSHSVAEIDAIKPVVRGRTGLNLETYYGAVP